jgi:NitT/TauT family transport system substrate-binding protein
MRPRALIPILAAALVLTACTTPGASPSASPSVIESAAPSASPSEDAQLRPVRLLLGFRPDVQFAPFYLAQQGGYFADQGLEVTIEHASGGELIRLVADGQAEFGVADATDVMIARTSGIPVRYFSTLYRSFPVAVIGSDGDVPTDPGELAGRSIGTPGQFGSSWHALLALLDAGGLTPADVRIREYPQFNQVEGLLGGDVELITGFRSNEPLRLEAEGVETDLLLVDEIAPLPGPGLIAGDEVLDTEVDLAKAFAHAVELAQEAIVQDPDLGLAAAVETVPTIGEDEATALAVLEATIAVWLGNLTYPNNVVDQTIWCPGYRTMLGLGFIDGSVPIEDMVDIRAVGTTHGTFGCEEY